MSVTVVATRALVLASVLTAVTACQRDLSSLASIETVQRITGGKLCRTAKVRLTNYKELQENEQASDLQFEITTSAECSEAFARSLFDASQLLDCSVGSGNACIKHKGNDQVSIFRRTLRITEVNVW